MPEAEGYEVQGTPYLQEKDRNALIHQVSEELIAKSPTYGFKVSFHGGDQMTIVYHTYEMDLPLRIREVDDHANSCLKEWEKHVKKEYKSRGGGTLKLKEKKDARQSSSEKVSLNNRYYFRSSRTYDLS